MHWISLFQRASPWRGRSACRGDLPPGADRSVHAGSTDRILSARLARSQMLRGSRAVAWTWDCIWTGTYSDLLGDDILGFWNKLLTFNAFWTNEHVQPSISQAKELFPFLITDFDFFPPENYRTQTQRGQTYLLWLIACNIPHWGLICPCFQLWISTTLFQSPFRVEIISFRLHPVYCAASEQGAIS